MSLLENMDAFIDNLDKITTNDKIFTPFCNGFTDAAPIIREATVKAVLQMAPHVQFLFQCAYGL